MMIKMQTMSSEDIIKKIREDIIQRELKVALFLGAGSSIFRSLPEEKRLPSGYKLMMELGRILLGDGSLKDEEIKKQLENQGYDTPEKVWTAVVGNKITRSIRIIQKIFNESKPVPPQYFWISKLLLDDFINVIVTVNFDEKLEEAIRRLKNKRKEWQRITVNFAFDEDSFGTYQYNMISHETKNVYKLHGTLSMPDRIISNPNELTELTQNKVKVLRQVLEGNNSMVLVGYRGCDEDIKNAFRNFLRPLDISLYWVSLWDDNPFTKPDEDMLNIVKDKCEGICKEDSFRFFCSLYTQLKYAKKGEVY